MLVRGVSNIRLAVSFFPELYVTMIPEDRSRDNLPNFYEHFDILAVYVCVIDVRRIIMG